MNSEKEGIRVKNSHADVKGRKTAAMGVRLKVCKDSGKKVRRAGQQSMTGEGKPILPSGSPGKREESRTEGSPRLTIHHLQDEGREETYDGEKSSGSRG